MTREEILDAVRRTLGKSGLDKAKAPEMPSDELTKAALATLMATRANELTDALSETRSNVIHRYTEKQLDEQAASAILTALDRTRSVALADETEAKPEDSAKPEDKAEQALELGIKKVAAERKLSVSAIWANLAAYPELDTLRSAYETSSAPSFLR